MDIDQILALVKQALPVAKLLAGVTATQWDDRAVALMEAAVASPALIDLLRIIFNDPEVASAVGHHRTLAITNALATNITDDQEAAAKAAGFSWIELVKLLPLIIRMLLSVSGKRA